MKRRKSDVKSHPISKILADCDTLRTLFSTLIIDKTLGDTLLETAAISGNSTPDVNDQQHLDEHVIHMWAHAST